MDIEELIIREAIRKTISNYAIAGDSADYAVSARTFCEDGRIVVQGKNAMIGREAIEAGLRAGYRARGGDRPGHFQRHNILTCRIVVESPTRASATTYVQVLTELGFDHAGTYRDQFEPTPDGWLIKVRDASVDWMRPDSRFNAWPGAKADQ